MADIYETIDAEWRPVSDGLYHVSPGDTFHGTLDEEPQSRDSHDSFTITVERKVVYSMTLTIVASDEPTTVSVSPWHANIYDSYGWFGEEFTTETTATENLWQMGVAQDKGATDGFAVRISALLPADAQVDYTFTYEAVGVVIIGRVEEDEIHAGDGHDYVEAFSRNHVIYAHAGDDTVDAGPHFKDLIVKGGAGNDSITGGDGAHELHGGQGADTILSVGPTGTVFGGDGRDDISGYGLLDGGRGNDTITVFAKGATISGGGGDDYLTGRDAASVAGGDGNDTIDFTESFELATYSGGNGDDYITTSRYADVVEGGKDQDLIFGNDGTDILYGDQGDDTLYGGKHNDGLHGKSGDDLLYGEQDDDHLYGGNGNDFLKGGKGDDYLDGGAGKDEMLGGKDDDFYFVRSVSDTVTEYAGEGNDTISTDAFDVNLADFAEFENIVLTGNRNLDATGDSGANLLVGGSGNNTLDGRGRADTISGFEGDNILLGGNGDDLLFSGSGNDTLAGGDGIDTFLFDPDFATDRITDFEVGVDFLGISADIIQSFDLNELWKYFTTSGGNSYFDFGNGNILTIEGVTDGNTLQQDTFLY